MTHVIPKKPARLIADNCTKTKNERYDNDTCDVNHENTDILLLNRTMPTITYTTAKISPNGAATFLTNQIVRSSPISFFHILAFRLFITWFEKYASFVKVFMEM